MSQVKPSGCVGCDAMIKATRAATEYVKQVAARFKFLREGGNPNAAPDHASFTPKRNTNTAHRTSRTSGQAGNTAAANVERGVDAAAAEDTGSGQVPVPSVPKVRRNKRAR